MPNRIFFSVGRDNRFGNTSECFESVDVENTGLALEVGAVDDLLIVGLLLRASCEKQRSR